MTNKKPFMKTTREIEYSDILVLLNCVGDSIDKINDEYYKFTHCGWHKDKDILTPYQKEKYMDRIHKLEDLKKRINVILYG